MLTNFVEFYQISDNFKVTVSKILKRDSQQIFGKIDWNPKLTGNEYGKLGKYGPEYFIF